MSFRKYRASQNVPALFLATVSVAHICALQFFPLYLKNLNFSATEVGIIRASQTWVSALLIPAWLFLRKQLQSVSLGRVVMTVFLVLNITLHLCLAYLPPSNMLQDVTHCHRHTSFTPMEGLVEHNHNKQWNHFKLTTYMPSYNASVKIDRPTTNAFQTNKETTAYLPLSATNGHTSLSLSMVIKQNSLPRVIHHDTEHNVSSNSHISSQNHFKVLTESSAKQNLLLDSITQVTKNIKFFQNVRFMSSPTTEKSFLPVTGSDVSLVPKDKHKPEVLINNGSNTFLNRSQSKIQSEYRKILLNEKATNQNAITDDKRNNSTEQVPDSGSDSDKIYNGSKVVPTKNESVIGHIIPMNKTWYNWSQGPQSEPLNAHSHKEFYYFKQYSEQQNIPAVSKTNKTGNTKFHGTWLPKHSVIPWVPLKNMKKYYAQSSGFRNVSHAISSYSRTENSEESSNDEQSTNRLKAETVVREEESVESPQESENKINITITPADVRLWGEYQNSLFQLLRKHKSGRKTEQAEREGNSLPTTAEEGGDLPAARRMQKNIKQRKEIDPHDRHLRIKRVSISATHKSQEAEQFSRNIAKKFSRKHPAHLTIQQYDVTDVKYRRHRSPCSKTLNCRETQVATPVQGSIRRLMSVDSSKSIQFDDDTDVQVDKLITPWSFRNISPQLWNITIDKLPGYWSTTFSTILLLAVFTDMFSTATTATSSQFLQSERITKASGHRSMILQNNFLQIYTLLGWGLFGCPLLAGLVLATECSYQPRVFFMLSTSLFVISLLELFLFRLPIKNRDLKLQDYVNKENKAHIPLLQRFGYGVSVFFTGFAMACNSEFIQWHTETLHGFPYNYQLLYCSYIGIGTFIQAIVRSWLQRKQLNVLVHVQDCTNPGNHDVGNADGLWNTAVILLGLHFLAASLLQPAWVLVFLGILQGCCAAFIFSVTTSLWWAIGYGLGCLFGGVMVDAYGSDWLFWVMAGSMFVWSATLTLCGGMMKCIKDYDRGRASYSQLVPPEGESDDEEVTVYESGDWLEKALEEEEQQVQRWRNVSCPT